MHLLFSCSTTVVYHIATMMPNKESDPSCTKKKLHIGNNHVTIVYNDSKMDYKIGTIKVSSNCPYFPHASIS